MDELSRAIHAIRRLGKENVDLAIGMLQGKLDDQGVEKVRKCNDSREPFITVQMLGSGYAAVEMVWTLTPGYSTNHLDVGGFWEPNQTGIGRYRNRKEAENEAKEWAEAEGIDYVGSDGIRHRMRSEQEESPVSEYDDNDPSTH